MRYVLGILLLASPAFAGEPVYSWRTRADETDRIYLYLDGNQIGGWDYRIKQYRPFDGKNWGPPTDTPPVRPPQNLGAVHLQLEPIVITQQNLPSFQMRGPVQMRRPIREGIPDAMAQLMADMFVETMFDAVPRAILDSLVKGKFKVVPPSPQQQEGRTTPPGPGRPMRSPLQRWRQETGRTGHS